MFGGIWRNDSIQVTLCQLMGPKVHYYICWIAWPALLCSGLFWSELTCKELKDACAESENLLSRKGHWGS